MSLKIIKILIYGTEKKITLETPKNDFDSEYYNVEYFYSESEEEFISKSQYFESDIILIIGNSDFLDLIKNQKLIDKNKILYISLVDWQEQNKYIIANKIFQQYIQNSIEIDNKNDLISVYTVTCNTKEKIKVAYESLLNQTHKNWEWIIYDDSSDNETWNIVKELAKKDCRIKINRNNNNSQYSRIGYNKYNAAANCSSEYILELDHDDAFYKTALENILFTHKKFPNNGFIYGDWVEINFETKDEIDYGGGNFALGYGSYYEIDHEFHNRKMKVCCAPDINALTIRRMWSLCNHPKSWKKSFYFDIGGHNKNLNSADDYELIIRTFLNTEMVHLKNFCYYQYFYNQNTKVSNGGLGWAYHGDIIRHVKYIEEFYRLKIKNRIEQLGTKDLVYDRLQETKGNFSIRGPINNIKKLNIDFKI